MDNCETCSDSSTCIDCILPAIKDNSGACVSCTIENCHICEFIPDISGNPVLSCIDCKPGFMN